MIEKREQSLDECVEFVLRETATGEVTVTMPDGQVFLLELGQDDAYHRESVLAARVADTIAKRVPELNRVKPEPPPLLGEHLYTPQELAKLASVHVSTIRRMFIDEPGVIVRGKQSRRNGKRDYVTLRIPASVAERKLRQLMKQK
jgi:hypothetical protein